MNLPELKNSEIAKFGLPKKNLMHFIGKTGRRVKVIVYTSKKKDPNSCTVTPRFNKHFVRNKGGIRLRKRDLNVAIRVTDDTR